MDKLTRQLSEFAASLSFEQIPVEIVDRAKRSLVDAFGCMYGGRNCKAATIWRDHVVTRPTPGRHAGRAIGVPGWMAADDAAFINAAMIRYLGFGDSWHGGHPSDMLGGFLALAESSKASGKGFITAMVVAYEVMLRLIRAARMGDRGFDQGFVIGIGTVCGLGSLLRLPVDTIANAVGMIAAANVPLRVTRSGLLSNWKAVATPYANRNGVFAILLAMDGLTGPSLPFEGRNGLFEQITQPFEIEPLGTKGGRWLMELVRLKYWAVEQHLQAAVWAALELRSRMKVDEIESIVVQTYHFTWFETGSEPAKWDPKTRETADHSLPYTMARALVDGTITNDTWQEAAFLDPSLRPLMNRISIEISDELEARYPEEMTMRLKVTAKDGRQEAIEIANPRGDGKNPMDDADVAVKFHRMADPVIGPDKADAIIATWRAIDQASDMATAIDLLHYENVG